MRGALLLLALGLGACAGPRERIVLLPGTDGKTGQIVVSHGGRDSLLDAPYSSAAVQGGATELGVSDADAVRAAFGATLDALPPRPVSYFLYFIGDSDELTPESTARAPEILSEIERRPAAELLVIGHTDTRADDAHNDRLSMARAEAVRRQLAALGFDPQRIVVAGRGERELAVKTAEEVDEERNRRAEIIVR